MPLFRPPCDQLDYFNIQFPLCRCFAHHERVLLVLTDVTPPHPPLRAELLHHPDTLRCEKCHSGLPLPYLDPWLILPDGAFGRQPDKHTRLYFQHWRLLG